MMSWLFIIIYTLVALAIFGCALWRDQDVQNHRFGQRIATRMKKDSIDYLVLLFGVLLFFFGLAWVPL